MARNTTHIRGILREFENNNRLDTIRYIPAPGEYSSLNSAASSFRQRIKTEHLPIAVRTINKRIYLIHTDRVQARPVNCDVCINRGNLSVENAIGTDTGKERNDETLA